MTENFGLTSIVIIDEINSAPIMESLLNNLLMGFDAQGNRPHTPGFIIIGTQNPAATMGAGRRLFSEACSRRLCKSYLQPYSHDEILKILIDKGLKEDAAQDLAQQNNSLTFRDLLKQAKILIIAKGKQQQKVQIQC